MSAFIEVVRQRRGVRKYEDRPLAASPPKAEQIMEETVFAVTE